MKKLDGKIALITGGTRGIGKAIALLFAQNGCNIAFTYIHGNEAAKELIKEIQSFGVMGQAFKCDAANFNEAHTVLTDIVAQWGRLDILVCNAGITRDTLLMRMTEQQWDDVINTNLKSVFNYCHAVSLQMLRQKSGNIIAISSAAGQAGNAGQANYAASKAGIIGFVKSMSKELGGRNIRVNAIAPGFIETDMTHSIGAETHKQSINMIPLNRWGEPHEVANVALFLASDMASYVTGQVISVNGGML